MAEEMGLPKATLYSWIAAEWQRNRQGITMNRRIPPKILCSL
ncbi:hypothetical protein [Fibrobacter sp. UWR4]